MKIYFSFHSTTRDNEDGVASGWNDVELSERGIQESTELGNMFSNIPLDIVCCSDLRRSVDTARTSFGDRIDIIIDRRLREINYGDFNGKSQEIIGKMRKDRIQIPFPNGESYQQAIARVQEFLRELGEKYPGKTILIIGHRATRYGLETLLENKSVEECIDTPLISRPYHEYDW